MAIRLLPGYADVTSHPSNHWETAKMLATLIKVSLQYQAEKVAAIRLARGLKPEDPLIITTAEKVIINDISLPRGGVFDVNGTWTNPHVEHRDGTVADVATEASGTDENLRRLWQRETKLEPFAEGNHLHVRIQGGYAR